MYTHVLAFLSPAVIPTTLLTKATRGGLVVVGDCSTVRHLPACHVLAVAHDRACKGLLDMTGNGVGNSFEFVVLASLRVRQLVDGCTPRVEGEGKKTTIAKREVLAGKVARIAPVIPG